MVTNKIINEIDNAADMFVNKIMGSFPKYCYLFDCFKLIEFYLPKKQKLPDEDADEYGVDW